jgi:hypothetical protein
MPGNFFLAQTVTSGNLHVPIKQRYCCLYNRAHATLGRVVYWLGHAWQWHMEGDYDETRRIGGVAQRTNSETATNDGC